MDGKAVAANIDDYISSYPPEIRRILTQLREAIRKDAPDAVEKISYQMPTFFLEGNLVHFAVHSRHIGFYPSPSGIEAFKDEISKYKWAKGSVQFPIGEPLPLDLISKIVKFRVEENLRDAYEKRAAKAAARRKPKA